MTLVLDKLRALLPAKAKSSPSGWTSFNAPCCHHRGHKPDTRKRAGVRFDDGFIYNCFNCKFTANWKPGRGISEKLKSLCRWLGADESDIKDLVFEALKTESDDYVPAESSPSVFFSEKELPEGAMPLLEWVNSEYYNDIATDIEPIIAYVVNRGHDPFDGNFYWTPADGYIDRVIIPYFYEGKIVGNTARKIRDGKPKYVSDQHPHFVFNIDNQKEEHRYIFVVEGQFDALAIGGVGLLTNDVAEQQSRIINRLGKKVIVIPDQDKAGLNLINKAIELDWAVAFPTWEDGVKDVADAVKKYGKLFVIVDAISTAEQGAIKLNLAKKKLESKINKEDNID
jgi:hypothetical protein